MRDLTASVVREGLSFGEGPRWHDGRLWYSDFFDQAVHALRPGGDDERVVEVASRPSGLGWMPDGSLLIVSMLDRRLLRMGTGGSVSEHADLSAFAAFPCNDMVVDSRGVAYVGHFGVDFYGGTTEFRPATLLRVDPDGRTSIAADDMHFPNGSVITPDGRTLIVGESSARRLTAFDIDADGSLRNRRVWADLAPAKVTPDGSCLDASGAVWVANARSNAAVRVAEGGEILATVTTSQLCFACMLGGSDGRELYCLTAPSPDPGQAAERLGRIESVRVEVPHAGLP
jgi:sugar lactone lactonase YvrE